MRVSDLLFHISEDPGITRFEPRPSEYTDEPVVWAITHPRLCNYLVPRDCPRVTFYAGPRTTVEDRERFLGPCSAVVAIEAGWLPRIHSTRLYRYQMPPETFQCLDPVAGYFVSRVAVVPSAVEPCDPVPELQRRGVELRVLPGLWELRDAVVASSLAFSLIRMRNALPRGAP